MKTETKTHSTGSVQACQNCKQDFTIEKEDFNFYEKIKVPPPTFCPDCRSQRRLAWKNNTSLYNRTCGLCGKNIVTIYSPESKLCVYCIKCWWSDKWDPKSYGRDYDFSRPFFEQMKDLQQEVPAIALMNDNGLISGSVNCEYNQDFASAKNCYMVFVAWRIENVMYSFFMLNGKDMMDCINIRSKNEWLYECNIARNCYNLKFCKYSLADIDSAFLDHCSNCSDCFMCYGLVSKKYYFKNKQYSKQEYEKILESYHLDTYSGQEKAKGEFGEFLKPYFRRYAEMFHCVNSTGDVMSYSKNCKNCFVTKDSENCRYADLIADVKDSYDISGGGEFSEGYENITCDNSSRNFFGVYSWKNEDARYTEHCHSSRHLFGCVGLRKGRYSILNKEYTKEAYEKLVEKIIAQMSDAPYTDKAGNVYKYGEFYPTEHSPFGYNETMAIENFPLQKDEVLKKGYNWQDNLQRTTGQETLKPEDIPDSINNVTDSILEEVLKCIECGRNYKIVPNELLFYRKMKIPVARKCFYCRHNDWAKKRNPFKHGH